MLRLAFATGTEPGKWFARFRDNTAHGGLKASDSDDAVASLLAGEADVALARIPSQGGDPRIDESFHVVRLYEEAVGVAVPKDSLFAEVGEVVDAPDLEGEYLNYRIDDSGIVDVPAVRAGLQVVAANVGIVIAPRPLLKVLSKKQVIPLGLCDPAVPATTIALVWPRESDSDAIQDFVGIAKGRTANSSRQEQPKRSAREKAKAKQARREGNSANVKGAKRRSLPNSKKPSHRRKRR